MRTLVETTFDDPEDIVEELLALDAWYASLQPDQETIYKRAADEISRLRRVVGMTSN